MQMQDTTVNFYQTFRKGIFYIRKIIPEQRKLYALC